MYGWKSNESLIEGLVQRGVLQTEEIIEAFNAVDRKDFLPEKPIRNPYVDAPISIEHGQTNSQPATVAFMLELLEPKKGNEILDIGCGSGWTTALLAEIVGEDGNVTGLEIIPELVEFGRENLEKYDFNNASIKQAEKDRLGMPGKKFDRILVSAAAREIPTELCSQLKSEGIMAAPVQNSIFKFTNHNGELEATEYKGFAFVPLVKG